MVAKDREGNNAAVPGLELCDEDDIRRFINCLKQIELKKERDLHEEKFNYSKAEAFSILKKYPVVISAS